jgi:hypothetical protein
VAVDLLDAYVVEQLLERGDKVTVFTRGAYPELTAMGVLLFAVT